ncbi:MULTISPECIES: endonuclease MutS2 [unclassified Halanaerobium]|uniref:endonuclease MutS2 n=1 Tax=unclassified Halanaerobium TaxID=2641197 RepID=UPI000DF1F442|nr:MULTISPECIES: endonuclease MutS2 [unclassified Halanaerobium]RCW50492.1 DNA mismatch repair protein MutS2 [Halanaerobium sp. MA284_MarDTE_T2]RCW85979.1 DNA mismatch repair protein MutS2 [Halanaerobium sp. DL-01]
MKKHTLKVLEYRKIIDMIADRSATNIGKEIIKKLEPVSNRSYIEKKQREITAVKGLISEYGNLPFSGTRDIRDEIKKSVKGVTLSTSQIVDVRSTLRGFSEMKKHFSNIESELDPRLIEKEYGIIYDFIEPLRTIPQLEREIDRCINDYGEVDDNASSALKSFRDKIDSIENGIRDKLESIIKSSRYEDMLQESLVTRRENRYVVPVKQEQRSNFDGIVHGQSASGMTVFMEPIAVVKMNNELREVKAKEEAEVHRILQKLTALIAAQSEVIKNNLIIISHLDVISASARFSLDFECSQPVMNEKALIDLKQAKHPLLKNDPVPIDVQVGDKISTLVITGPNTGGKTVALKTIGLLTLMAQTGLHIPAEANSTLPVFVEIFADIGDEQSIEQNLSTFSSHMNKIKEFLHSAGNRTLVLMDELGVGTDPEEGAALGIAILEKLQEKNAVTVATTHYSQLKSYAYSAENVENASVEFDIETLKPTYRLIMGVPGGSNAFEIALKLGIPLEIIDRARSLLSEDEIKVEEIIKELNSERNRYQKLRQEMEEYRNREKELKEKYEKLISDQKDRHNKEIEAAKNKAEEILRETKKEAHRIISELKDKDYVQRSEVDRAQTEANKELKNLKSVLEETKSNDQADKKISEEEFEIGDQVRIRSLGRKGEIISLDKKKNEAVVQAGIIKITADILDLVKAEIPEDHKEEMIKNYRVQKSQHVSPKIDLRGDRYEEAQRKLDKYLDDVFLAGIKEVEIVHGKGTGALRDAVGAVLEKNPHISDFRLGRQEEGGTGVTIARIN